MSIKHMPVRGWMPLAVRDDAQLVQRVPGPHVLLWRATTPARPGRYVCARDTPAYHPREPIPQNGRPLLAIVTGLLD